jgi:ADP-ribose pyrophosphatase
MKIVSQKKLIENKLFAVWEEEATGPGGYHIKRAVVRHPGSAVMMPVDDKKRILLVRQYRLPAGRELWELAAGRLDPGETPLRAAKRELVEETGYSARRWTRLISFWASPGYVGEKMTIFLAQDLTAGQATPMDDERIRTQWFAAREVEEMIRTNKIMDAKTVVGYFTWKGFHKR